MADYFRPHKRAQRHTRRPPPLTRHRALTRNAIKVVIIINYFECARTRAFLQSLTLKILQPHAIADDDCLMPEKFHLKTMLA